MSNALLMTVVVVVSPGLAVGCAFGEEVVDGPQHRVRDCHHGFAVSPMAHDAAVAWIKESKTATTGPGFPVIGSGPTRAVCCSG